MTGCFLPERCITLRQVVPVTATLPLSLLVVVDPRDRPPWGSQGVKESHPPIPSLTY